MKVEQNQTAAKLIKLGVDVHADSYSVTRQMDHTPLQPTQKMSPPKFLKWVEKQRAQAERVVVCYEAGTFGYTLARQLEERGIECLVMVPINLDDGNQRVSNDRLDSRRIASRLSRYLDGDKQAMRTVGIPTVEEERQRDVGRQRQTLVKEIRRHTERGRAYMRAKGYRVRGRWWNGAHWKVMQTKLPAWMIEHLQVWVDVLNTLADKLAQVHAQLIAQGEKHLDGRPLPPGMGLLSYELLRLEIRQWERFKNRRQVASMTGLCPGESSSGSQRRQGSVTKHGNAMMRWVLVEMAWRLVRYQPDYHAVKKWREVLKNKKNKARRKQAIVAVARQLAIDLWRVAIGQTTLEKLGFNMAK